MCGWILHFSYLAKATEHFRGESSDHSDMREHVPQLLAQIVSTPLCASCELCLRSDLRTLAPRASDLKEGSREGLEQKTQFRNKTLSKRGI